MMKKKILLSVLTVSVVGCIVLGFFLKNNVVGASEVQTNLTHLDESLSKESNLELSSSSNPYDYIKNNTEYESIIKLGVSALPELENYLSTTDSNGLKEYLVAIMIEEITHTNVNAVLENDESSGDGWSNAKSFLKDWQKVKANANEKVAEILADSSKSFQQKESEINNLGVLAAPELKDIIAKNSSSEVVKEAKQIQESNDNLKLNDADLKVVTELIAK